MSISSTIKSIQDIMRKDVGVDGDAQRISQLVWMLFLKIYDDKEKEWETFDDNYKSPIPKYMRWRTWAADAEGITGEELKNFIDNTLFPNLQTLKTKAGDQRAIVIRSVFEDAYNYMKSGHLIRQVINKIEEGVDFNKAKKRHEFGNMYEQLLRDLQNAGNAGEFYTPRAVTEFMVQMIDPQLHESVIDPACGTGGFLTCTIEYKRKHYVKTDDDEQILQASIYGVEKKPLPHMLATTNMILHGIEIPSQIAHDNTLARPLRDWGPKDRKDIIIANPPFGGMEEDGIEDNFPQKFRTRETADLFMTLFIHLLKPTGRAAVVLPDGFLFGEGMKTRLKEHLLTECNLHTIVRLPNSVFAPYTGIKTNILFFEKGKPTKEVWYYEVPLPAGVKAFNKTRPMKLEHFADCMEWWGEGKKQSVKAKRKNRAENEQAWKVSIDDIVARNYNLNIPNPYVGEQISHDPDELLATYAQQQKQIQNLRDQLKTILSDALKG
jgi:type I restriction enzyme M protein